MKTSFELVAEFRETQGKGASRRLRHDGKVPAILYGGHLAARTLTLSHQKLLIMLENERFYSTILNLKVGDQSQAAILKDVQRHPFKNAIVHVDFQRAGSDIVEAFTYNGHREKMRVIGKEDLLEPLNRAALQIAREVADQRPGDLMAGNISNTNIWDPEDTARQAEVRGMFEEMVGWAVEGGADMIIGETFYYAGEALAALEVAKATGLPVVLTIAPMALEEMADGVGIVETCQRLEQAGADVVGMNCFRGPETMLPWLKQIRAAVSCHVGALPIPYRTTAEEPTFFNLSDDRARVPSPHGRTFPTALDPLYANRYEIGAFAKAVHNLGINYIGVCCGASPMLVRETAEAVGKSTEASRFSENMGNHFMYGDNERLPEHIVALGDQA